MRKKLWTLFPLIGIAGIVAGCGGTVSASSSSLDPAEKVTVSLIDSSFVSYHPDKIKTLVTSNVEVPQKPSSNSTKIAPGNAWLASVPNGPSAETVYVYFSPQMISGDQLMKFGAVKQGDHWLVHDWNTINVPQLSFSDFQKSPEYQSIGITHWTEVQIG
jgi:hypothetical protein